jgi:DNA-binding NtrC family response regulator
MADERVSILYVDDEAENLEVFRALFGGDYEVLTASSGAEALEILARAPMRVLLTDQRMPGMSGNRLLEQVTRDWPTVVSIVITAYTDADLMLGAIRAGHVHDYVIKPYRPEQLRETVASAVGESRRRRRLEEALRDRGALEDEVRKRYDPAQVVGAEDGLRDVMRQVRAAGPTGSTVLLIGETGTGKEMIARAIHAASPRAHRALVKIDCGALAPTLIESELFGHEKGAFTGATRERAGRFEQADGGTVFLDEVGDLPLDMQSRLLRVLQDRVVDRLGGNGPIPVDVRIIAATRRDLSAQVAAGSFREDLFYRLAVVPITLPPLRQRTGDIPALVRHFLAKHAPHRSAGYRIAPDAWNALVAHAWPGNIRELENLVERAVVLGAGPELGREDLLPFAPAAQLPTRAPEAAAPERDPESERLQAAIAQAGGNLTLAARLLNLPRSTFLNRLRMRGIR